MNIKKKHIMNTLKASPPLTNLQVELLSLFDMNLSEQDLIEVRRILAKFLLDKARDEAAKIWNERNYKDSDFIDD